MSPKTDRIHSLYNDRDRRASEILIHARKMEDGLHGAVRELERINKIEDGQPLVGQNLLNYLRELLS